MDTTNRIFRVTGGAPWKLTNAAEHTYEKEIIYVGHFEKHLPNGELEVAFDVDENLLQHWHNTYYAMSGAGIEIPLPKGHTTDPELKRGKVVGMRLGMREDGKAALYSQVQFISAEAAEANKNSNVSIYSPATSIVNGVTYYRPIVHVAVTDYPAIPGLGEFKAIALSLVPEKKTMALDTKALATKLGVAADTADDKLDSAIEAAIDKLLAEVKDAPPPKDPPADKKPVEASKDPPAPAPVVSASLVGLLAENREIKINQLVTEERITPAVATDLKKQWASKEGLTLSLSRSTTGEPNDGFDSTLAALKKMEPRKSGEKSGGQTFALSNSNSGTSGGESSLVKNAKAKAEAAKK